MTRQIIRRFKVKSSKPSMKTKHLQEDEKIVEVGREKIEKKKRGHSHTCLALVHFWMGERVSYG